MDALAIAFKSPGAPRAAQVARALGVTYATVHEWRTGRRPVPVQHCLALERVFGGAITRRELRPTDWHLIWPDIPAPAVEPNTAAVLASNAQTATETVANVEGAYAQP